jgi:hypothetical protein
MYEKEAEAFFHCLACTVGVLVDKAVLSEGTAGASVAEASGGPFVRISDLNTVMPWGGTKPRRSVAFNAIATSTISI